MKIFGGKKSFGRGGYPRASSPVRDPAMYALVTIPLIKKLEVSYKEVWYAGNATVVEK